MEEKERYKLESYHEAFCEIHDTKSDEWYLRKDLITDLLNQQDARIKELEQESYPAYKREHQRRAYLENIEVPKLKERIKELEEENQQLKQQLQDLPKNILKDIQENFDWNQCCEIRKYYDQPYIWFNYDAFNDFLDTILKKYGGENE